MPSIFAQKLKSLRNQHNVKQKDIADLLSVSIRAVVNYENGAREPDISGLTCLADYFGVSLDYLTGRSDDPRYEDFVDNAEAVFLNKIENLIVCGNNAEFLSLNEHFGAIGNSKKNNYNSLKQNFSLPLARLKLIFIFREMINEELEYAKKVVKNCKLPETNLINSIRNKFRVHEFPNIKPLKAGEKTSIQLRIEELYKLEEDFKRSKSNQKPET